MISNDIKTRIVLAISGNRQNYATDAKHAVALGISTSVYSEIKKGNTEQKLSDAKWMSIARRLGLNYNSLGGFVRRNFPELIEKNKECSVPCDGSDAERQ